MFLKIAFEALFVESTIHVNSKRGNAQDRFIDADQMLFQNHGIGIAMLQNDSASQRQVAIEPSLPLASAVSLDCKLEESAACLGSDRLQFEHRRVSVSANHVEPISSSEFVADHKSNDRGCVAGEIVLAPSFQFPRVLF